MVEQIKSRSASGTWSLKEVIEEVLPDLYGAADVTKPDTIYRFVTDGRMGAWEAVLQLWQSMRDRPTDSENPPSKLDNTQQVRFMKRQGEFWGAGPHTERSIFERLCGVLSQDARTCGDPLSQVQRKAWHLLGRFEFRGEQTRDLLERRLNVLLLEVAGSDVEVAQLRDAMLARIAKACARGGEAIKTSRFLAEHGISAVPLRAWPLLHKRARNHLASMLTVRQYVPAEDARPSVPDDLRSVWPGSVPMLVLAGESGQGKSWAMYAAASRFSEPQDGALVAFVDATENRGRSLETLDEIVSHDIRDSDERLPVRRVAQRLRKLVQLAISFDTGIHPRRPM
ncbi:MAG TPA: hypothetical protein VMZ50_09320, partial [Phycisphaerae bacterium]|nr:hypothetical protein [Phycisphaerae bacterium]